MEDNTFEYKGLVFKPLKNVEGDFFEKSRKIEDIGLTPEGWNHEEFYEIAEEKSKVVDTYKVDGTVVIPATECLFKYKG